MDDVVGLRAFAMAIGVSLSTEPHLAPFIEKCYRYSFETVGKARLIYQRDHSVSSTSVPTSSSDHQQHRFLNNSQSPDTSPRAATMPPLDPPPLPPSHSFSLHSNNNSASSSSFAGRVGNARAERRDVSPSRSGGATRATTPPRSRTDAVPVMLPSSLSSSSLSPSKSQHQQQQQGFADSSSSGFSTDVKDFARFIGIDPEDPAEAYLMPIAQEGLYAKLPAGWRKLYTGDGVPYYAGPAGESTFEFPLDENFRARVADARREQRQQRQLERGAAAVAAADSSSSRVYRGSTTSATSNYCGNASTGNVAALTTTTTGRGRASETVLVPITPHKGIDDRVEQMARYLGIDTTSEPHLLGIAREALLAPIPGWSRYSDESGNQYYGNDATRETTWELPNKKEFMARIDVARKRVSPAPYVAFTPPHGRQQADVSAVSTISSNSGSASSGVPSSSYSRELVEYAAFIGVPKSSFGADEELTQIVIEGFNAPLPADWASFRTQNGEVYYANETKSLSSYDHPLDLLFKAKVENVLKRRNLIK